MKIAKLVSDKIEFQSQVELNFQHKLFIELQTTYSHIPEPHNACSSDHPDMFSHNASHLGQLKHTVAYKIIDYISKKICKTFQVLLFGEVKEL